MADKSDIEAAIAIAEAETGVRGGRRKIPLFMAPSKNRNRIWTEDEKRFVRENHGRLSEDAIGEQLRRSRQAVHICITRQLHLVAPSKAPDILTAEQVAIGLGCDSKTIHLLMDSGRMPGRRLPMNHVVRVIDRLVFMKWLLNPDHWLYFKPGRVGSLRSRRKRGPGDSYDFEFWGDARSLMAKARRQWIDRWLTPMQAMKAVGIVVKRRPTTTHDRQGGGRYVNKAILKGNLKATRWGNWWIRKSDLPGPDKTINFCGEIVERRKEA